MKTMIRRRRDGDGYYWRVANDDAVLADGFAGDREGARQRADRAAKRFEVAGEGVTG